MPLSLRVQRFAIRTRRPITRLSIRMTTLMTSPPTLATVRATRHVPTSSSVLWTTAAKVLLFLSTSLSSISLTLMVHSHGLPHRWETALWLTPRATRLQSGLLCATWADSRYRPIPLTTGLTVSMASIIALLLWLPIPLRRLMLPNISLHPVAIRSASLSMCLAIPFSRTTRFPA